MNQQKRTFFKRVWAAAAACLVACSPLLAQGAGGEDGGAYMEIHDIYTDVHRVPISGGMTLYLPQGPSWREGAHAVLCDTQGQPVWTMPLREIANLRYHGIGAGAADLSLPQPPLELDNISSEQPYAYWRLQGQNHLIADQGEWQLSPDLSRQLVVTAKGEHYSIPLQLLERVEFNDSIPGVHTMMEKFQAGAKVYNYAFWNGIIENQDLMNIHFYTNFGPVSTIDPNDRFDLCYSLLIPTDEALQHWVDVVSFGCQKPRVMRITFRGQGYFPLTYQSLEYDFETGVNGRVLNIERMTEREIATRLRHLLRSHTILHNRPEDRELGLLSGNEFFQTLDGSIVRVVKENGQVTGVQGTFQLWNQQRGISTLQSSDEALQGVRLDRSNVTEARHVGDNWYYQIDNPIDATPLSVYEALTADETDQNPFRRFVDLCIPPEDLTQILTSCGLVSNSLTKSEMQRQTQAYIPFVDVQGAYKYLSYVDGHPFTLYVPTNEAIDRELSAQRLSSWSEIAQDVASCSDGEGNILDEADRQRIAAKVQTLTNFIRAHIHFGLEIADQLPFDRTHRTVLVKPRSLTTPLLHVQSTGQGHMTVTDETGNQCRIVDTCKNLFVRDIICSRNGATVSPRGMTTMNSIQLDRFSTGVIHQIDGVLHYEGE